jgi:signal transduction histidine kinase
MNLVAASQLYETLQSNRDAIAEAWYATLEKASPLPLETESVKASLATLTDQAIVLLTDEEFDADAACKMGVRLFSLGDMQPDDLLEMQYAFVEQVAAWLSPEQTAALQPRFVRLFGQLTLGFLMKESQQRRQFNMEAISKMGHDLKTPINSVTGFSRVILKGIDGPITDFQKQDLTSIYNAGKLLLDMIDELTKVSKQDESKQALTLDVFDLATFAGDIIATIQPILAENDHSLAVYCVGELGTMKANLSQVRWVVLSMLLHAARDMEPGTLSLTISREIAESVDWIFFRISRNALTLRHEWAGLEPETEEALKESHKDLGLMTAERFCRIMGGKILVTEMGEGGLSLIARLPAKVIEVVEDA